MMNELFQLFGLPVTDYALCIVLSAIIGIVCLLLRAKTKKLPAETAWTAAVLTLPLALIGARLFYVLSRFNMYAEMGMENAICLWQGGYMLFGALAGGAAAAALTAKLCRQKTSRVMDMLSAPAALVICLTRLSEYFSGEGIGEYVENEALCFFPLAVQNEWEEWHFAVFMLEALCALVIFIILMKNNDRADGTDCRIFLILFCACQVFLEQLRCDNYPRWLFVRVSQLLAVIVLFAILLMRRADQSKKHTSVVPEILFLVCAGVCVAMEFALDKWSFLPNWVCYTLILASSVGFGCIDWHACIKGKQ